MEKVNTPIDKLNKDEVKVKELSQKNKQSFEITDASIFDNTLKDIDQILSNLEEKSEIKQDTSDKFHALPEVKFPTLVTTVTKNELNKEPINEIEEHLIDQNLLTIHEVADIKESGKKKVKSFFSFYSYLIFIIVIFLTLYGALDVSKNLIISKYAKSAQYIQYFYEVIEIVKVSIFNLADYIQNKKYHNARICFEEIL